MGCDAPHHLGLDHHHTRCCIDCRHRILDHSIDCSLPLTGRDEEEARSRIKRHCVHSRGNRIRGQDEAGPPALRNWKCSGETACEMPEIGGRHCGWAAILVCASSGHARGTHACAELDRGVKELIGRKGGTFGSCSCQCTFNIIESTIRS